MVPATLVVGAILLGYSLTRPAGASSFTFTTSLLAIVWAGGALAASPIPVGAIDGRYGPRRPWAAGIVSGLLLAAVFLVGAVLVGLVPALETDVQQVLAHARGQVGLVVVLITALNGVAEELFFRGALFGLLPRRWALLLSTVLYAAVTATAGSPMLVLAGVLLSLVAGLQRIATGGVLAPILTHVVWSLTMLVALGPVLGLVTSPV